MSDAYDTSYKVAARAVSLKSGPRGIVVHTYRWAVTGIKVTRWAGYAPNVAVAVVACAAVVAVRKTGEQNVVSWVFGKTLLKATGSGDLLTRRRQMQQGR